MKPPLKLRSTRTNSRHIAFVVIVLCAIALAVVGRIVS